MEHSTMEVDVSHITDDCIMNGTHSWKPPTATADRPGIGVSIVLDVSRTERKPTCPRTTDLKWLMACLVPEMNH